MLNWPLGDFHNELILLPYLLCYWLGQETKGYRRPEIIPQDLGVHKQRTRIELMRNSLIEKGHHADRFNMNGGGEDSACDSFQHHWLTESQHGWVITCPVKCGLKLFIPFPNSNGYTVEVWEWKSNFITPFIMDVISYPWLQKRPQQCV